MESKDRSTEIEGAEAFEPYDASLEGLRIKVLVRLLIVALIPLIALSLYFRDRFIKTLEERCRVLLKTTAIQHQEAIDQFIYEKVAVLTSLVDTNLIDFPPSEKKVEQLLRTLRKIDDTILDVGVFDQYGNHISYAGPYKALEGKSYKNELWFETLSNSPERVFISDVYLGYRSQPHFIIATRRRVDGRLWFLRMTINPYTFSRLVNRVRHLEGTHAYIVNEEGVYQVVPEEIGSPLTEADNYQEAAIEKNVFESRGPAGEFLVAEAAMKSVKWKLIVRQKLSAAYAPVRPIQLGVLIIFGLGVLFIVITSLYATRTLVKRYSISEKNRAELIDQLVQAGKMTLMGEMAAGVAHEINNPLAVILTEAGVMEDFLDPALGGEFNQKDFLDRLQSIKEEAFRCRDIIHKLLGFARRTETTIEMYDLNQLVEESVDLVKREIALENITVEVGPKKSLSDIPTDGKQVKQVLLNLLRNSADAIGKDGKITINTADGKDYISFKVTDTGCGIPEENLSRLFHPFFTTKEVGKGTGLGLSISHGIITSLGGKISVASTVGKGTTFTIFLPKRRDISKETG